MSTVKTIVFLKEFLSKRLSIPFEYSLTIQESREVFSAAPDQKSARHLFLIKDVPDYLELQFIDPNKEIRSKKVRTLEGYYIDLKSFEDYNDYLQKKISAKSRSNFRKYQRRLEYCFDIKYMEYFGAIENEEYTRLFCSLRKFIERRFSEKREINYELPHLKEIENVALKLIMEKKASLCVIYHNTKPISIRLNMLYKGIAYYIISGYDIDYSSFRIGSVEMLKNIEWCFRNNFSRYDLLKGYHYYKKKWITHKYDYSDHLIYHTGIGGHFIRANFMVLKSNLRFRLLEISKRVFIYQGLKNLKRVGYQLRFGNDKSKHQWIDADIEIEKENQIDIFNDRNSFLLKPLYDFLFLNEEILNDISVFSTPNRPDTFHIIGKSSKGTLMIKSR